MVDGRIPSQLGNPRAVISDGQDNRKEGRKVSLEKEY
jgi:hypothetical protein